MVAKKKSGFRPTPKKIIDTASSMAFISQAGQPWGKDPAPPNDIDGPVQDLYALIDRFDTLSPNPDEMPEKGQEALQARIHHLRKLEALDTACQEQKWRMLREAGKLLSKEKEADENTTTEIFKTFQVTAREKKAMMHLAEIDNQSFAKAIEKAAGQDPFFFLDKKKPPLQKACVEKQPEGDGSDGPRKEIMDENYRQAVDQMITAIKTADENGWSDTSKATALDYVEMFRHMIMIDDIP